MQRVVATHAISGSTRVVGVIGWPVDHSLSPAIHNAAFAAAELDWVYVPMPVPPERIGEAVRGLRALGAVGANVTMPHKTDAARAVDERSADAELLDAVNAIVVLGDRLAGHNTDAPGFERFLVDDLGVDVRGRRAMIFGAGGAARAVALALGRLEVAAIAVVVRAPERAEPIRRVTDPIGTPLEVRSYEDAAASEADVLVNATPLGALGETLPLPRLGASTVGVDLLYRPSSTPLQDRVHAAGGMASGGLGLLVQQAALSFELWTGQRAPVSAMSAAAVAAVADGGGGRSADADA